MNEEFRAMTKNQRSFESAVMMSSLMPSEKYSCSGSPLIFANGRTAIAGLSSAGRPVAACKYSDGFPGAASDVASGAHIAHETKALARKGADQPLILAIVGDRHPRGIDAAGQRGVGDDAAAPHRSDEIILADDPFSILHQIDEQVEHLGLERHGGAAAA